jgi:hypothetical protein
MRVLHFAGPFDDALRCGDNDNGLSAGMRKELPVGRRGNRTGAIMMSGYTMPGYLWGYTRLQRCSRCVAKLIFRDR